MPCVRHVAQGLAAQVLQVHWTRQVRLADHEREPRFGLFYQFKVELLAGVSASGFLCGSFYILNENS